MKSLDEHRLEDIHGLVGVVVVTCTDVVVVMEVPAGVSQQQEVM